MFGSVSTPPWSARTFTSMRIYSGDLTDLEALFNAEKNDLSEDAISLIKAQIVHYLIIPYASQTTDPSVIAPMIDKASFKVSDALHQQRRIVATRSHHPSQRHHVCYWPRTVKDPHRGLHRAHILSGTQTHISRLECVLFGPSSASARRYDTRREDHRRRTGELHERLYFPRYAQIQM